MTRKPNLEEKWVSAKTGMSWTGSQLHVWDDLLFTNDYIQNNLWKWLISYMYVNGDQEIQDWINFISFMI